MNIYEAVKNYSNMLSAELVKLNWVLVDEAQFLTEKQVEELTDVVDNLGINVMCFGLRTDFLTNSFPASRRLFELADSIQEIKSVCKCGNKAIINARIDEQGQLETNGHQVVVGRKQLVYTNVQKMLQGKT